MRGESRPVALREDGAIEYEALPEDEREVIEPPDGDPLKRGEVSSAVAITTITVPRPERQTPLAAQRRADILVATDIHTGLAAIAEEEAIARRRRLIGP